MRGELQDCLERLQALEQGHDFPATNPSLETTTELAQIANMLHKLSEHTSSQEELDLIAELRERVRDFLGMTEEEVK
jgi:hypothetical protein